MLCQFSFENFKSYKDEVTLDLYAEPLSEHKETLICDKDGEKFLPICALYGPNGGGKSNVLDAMSYLFSIVIDFATYFKIKNQANYYHKFDKEYKKRPTKFSILFRTKKHEVKYELAVLGLEIVEENLYTREIGEKDAEILIERSQKEIILGGALADIPVSKISKNIPFLTYFSINYSIKIIDEIMSWFKCCRGANFGNALQESYISVPGTKQQIKKVIYLLNQCGINIDDIRVVKEKERIKEVYTKRVMSNGEVIELNFNDESSGTQKIFSFLRDIILALETGCLLIVDELDAKLHPKLLQYIIELFTNKNTNKNGAQLIITSHDISTMNKDVFRRDEIWFCALNPDNASNLYSLFSFQKEDGTKTRKDESYGKRYLEGKYGADPYFKKITQWCTNEQ